MRYAWRIFRFVGVFGKHHAEHALIYGHYIGLCCI